MTKIMIIKCTSAYSSPSAPRISHFHLLILCCFFSIFIISTVARATIEESPNNVKKLADDLSKTKESFLKEEIKQKRVTTELLKISRKMKKIVSERGSLIQDRMAIEQNTKELASKILEIEKTLKSQKTLLRSRISVIYKLGGQGLARILFSSSSSIDLDRNLKILGLIAKKDLDLIKDYSTTVKDLEKKKNKMIQRLAYLKTLEKNIVVKEKSLKEENDSKSTLLTQIRQSKQFVLLKLNNLREKSQKLNIINDSGVYDLLFRPSFFEKKGEISPPIQAPIAQEFGLMKDEKFNVVLSHKGLFFKAPLNTPIKAAFPGRVVFSDELIGYGLTIILDHGDHYYTVYAYNNEISVEEGDEVKQEQVISSSGNSFLDFGQGLYFEIRHFSEPYDPRSWLKGTAL